MTAVVKYFKGLHEEGYGGTKLYVGPECRVRQV